MQSANIQIINHNFFIHELQFYKMAKEQTNTGIAHNMLTNGTKIVGTITTDKDIRIDGNLEGDIICNGKIVLGSMGTIKGNVQCTSAEIMGTIEGKIKTSEMLSLKSTSRINGEIKTRNLSIEPNAQFNGTCEMNDDKKGGKH